MSGRVTLFIKRWLKNNDNNTPLDLAIADGASPNVVALLQGKTVPPTDDEVLQGAKARCERAEKEMARLLSAQDGMHDDLEIVLSLLMDIREHHPHSVRDREDRPRVEDGG